MSYVRTALLFKKKKRHDSIDLIAVVIDFATYLAPQLLRNVSIFSVVRILRKYLIALDCSYFSFSFEALEEKIREIEIIQ